MTDERVVWRADDPERSAMSVGGRPVHAWWMLLKPSFRRVLMEPRRRAGAGTVGWVWASPEAPAAPSVVDLTDVRARLKEALLDLSDEMERRREPVAGLSPAELVEAMRTMVNGLVRAADAELSAQAVLTPGGWMVRSWGITSPAAALREQDGTESREGEQAGTSAAGDAPSGQTSGRRRSVTVIAVVLALVAALTAAGVFWTRRAGGTTMPVEHVPTETVQDVAKYFERTRTPERQERGERAGMPDPRMGSVTGVVGVGAGATGGEREPSKEREADPWAMAAVPGATVGGMAVTQNPRGAAAGPASKVTGEPDTGSFVANPGKGAPADSTPVGDAQPGGGSGQGRKGATAGGDVMSLAFPDSVPPPAEGTGPSRKARDVPPARASPPGPGLDIEARKQPGVREPDPPEPGEPTPKERARRTASSPDDVAGHQPEPAGAGVPRRLPQPEAQVATDDKTTTRNVGEPAEPAGTGLVSASLAVDYRSLAWQVGTVEARTVPDIVLPTWPGEGDSREAVATARAAALAAMKARLPEAFRSPQVKAGLELVLAPAEVASRPVWVDARSRRPLDGASIAGGGSRVRLVWPELVPGKDFGAVLLSGAGRELARLRVRAAERRIEVVTAAGVLEVAPWFALGKVAGGDTLQWRSLSPAWSSARWENVRVPGEVGIVCRVAEVTGDGPVEGVLALVDSASGWALAWPVRSWTRPETR
jgi:hypothetical protein